MGGSDWLRARKGKGVTGGKEGTKEDPSSLNCVQEGRAPHSTGGKS